MRRLLPVVVLALTLTGVACAIPTIMVFPSVAPNAYGSPSYPGYVSNAIFALENNLSTNGTPGTPEYYEQVSSIAPSQVVATGFPSWLGQADPGTVFGAPFAGELGNRPLFGVVIDGNGTQFSISQLSFLASSNDPGNMLGFSYGAGHYQYSSDYVGIIFGGIGIFGPVGPVGSVGPVGLFGPGQATFVTSGPDTQLVDEIVGRGSGNADAAYCPGCTIAQQQAAIDALAPSFAGMTTFAGTYTLTDFGGGVLATGSGSFDVTPEPASFVLVGAAMLAWGIARRKLRSH